MSRNIAYLRVSTVEQDIEKNKSEILHLANDKVLGKVEFVEEKISGKVHWKQRKIGHIIEELEKGDTLLGLCQDTDEKLHITHNQYVK